MGEQELVDKLVKLIADIEGRVNYFSRYLAGLDDGQRDAYIKVLTMLGYDKYGDKL